MLRIRKWLVFILFAFVFSTAQATHLVGGYLSYRFLGTSGTNSQFRVTIYAYRDCSPTDGGVPFDAEVGLCIYNDNRTFYNSYKAKKVSEKSVNPVGNTACPEVAKACLKQGIYEVNITLPSSLSGYHLKWERCCRNTQNNLIDNSGIPYQGQTYYGYIPPTAIQNSSPYFLDLPVPFICAGDTTTIRNRVLDPDGDSLSYRLVTPWQGGQANWVDVLNCPDPMSKFDTVEYVKGFGPNIPFGKSGYAFVDAFNGLTTYMAPSAGRYAVAIEVTEWRNRIAISFVRLDLQIMAINCGINNKPKIGYASGSSSWFVEAGEKICIKVNASDTKDTNDVITLRAYADILSGINGYKGSKATMTPASNSARKKVESEFCWTPDCNINTSTPFRVTFEAFDNGCPSKFVNENVFIYVKPFLPVETIKGKVNLCQNSQSEQYEIIKYNANRKYKWSAAGGTIDGVDTGKYVKVNWGNLDKGKIIVTITNLFGCSKEIILQVDLIKAPAKPILIGLDTVCLNQQSQFSTDKIETTYKWNVSGGSIISSGISGPNTSGNFLAVATVLWNKSGPGWVSIFAINSIGCSSVADTHRVFVSSPAGSGIIGPISVCPNNRGILYSLDKKYWKAKYSWSVIGANNARNINDTLFSVDWGFMGVGTIQVIVKDRFGCTDTAKLTVKKNHALAGQLPKGPNNLCELSKGILYKVNPVKGETYLWNVLGGVFVGPYFKEEAKIDWGIVGVGYVSVISSAYDSISKLPCLSAPSKLTVKLNGAPVIPPLNNLILCQTSKPLDYITLTDKSTPKTRYEWNFGGLAVNISLSSDSITWKFGLNIDTFGSFPVKIRAISGNGCIGPWVNSLITINQKPRNQSILGKNAVCFPNISGFEYSISGLSGSTFSWSVGGGSFAKLPSATDTKIIVDWTLAAAPGFVQVIEKSEKGCVGDTLRAEVFVDNSTIDLKWVSIAPPPNPDGSMWLRFQLQNAPRNIGFIDIERRPAGGLSFSKVGTAQVRDTLYIDYTIGPDISAYEYRVSTKNLCGETLYSAAHTSILLNGLKTGSFSMNISFSNYIGFMAGIARYDLYRSLPGTSDFALYKSYPSPQGDDFANGKDNYQQIFRIKAYELNGDRVSWSNDIVINYEPVVFIPNAFSPNRNGMNEVFLPFTGGIKLFHMDIFNRWGEKVFESNSSTEGWNGEMMGKPAMEGIYVYQLQYTDFRGKQYQTGGTLHLIR